MPYVPSDREVRRLRAALDRAAFSEAERIMWLLSFLGLCTLEGIMIGVARTWTAVLLGSLASIGGSALLYWRLRGGYLSSVDPELHGIGLRTEAQRAFTALMVRQAFTGRNALRAKPEHDPFATWSQRVEKAQAPVEEEVAEADA